MHTPAREDYPAISKKLNKIIGIKSDKELYANYRNFDLRLDEDILKVFPSIYYNKSKPSRGLSTYEKGIVVFPEFENNKLKIAEKVFEMLDIDYKAMQLRGELEV